MSAYDDARDQAYLQRLSADIAEFAQNYNGAQSRGTVFLFLGGLASQLVRADAAYPATPSNYDLLWIDFWGILSGTAIDLQMAGDDDYLDQFILPDGAIDSIFVQPAPYDGFIQWCEGKNIDLFVFGWDWRRSSAAAANFFFDEFLPEFVAGVQNCHPNPLSNCWLIGHSFGGMVVKQIVNQFNNPFVQQIKGAITVATPFYGYGGQLHRFFKGDPDLNFSEGSQGPTVVTKIISSLAAGYELLFLDWPTYNANQYAFANDPEGYDLTSYPIVDRNSGQPADPYNPVPGKPVGLPPALVRYLPNYGFNWNFSPAAIPPRSRSRSRSIHPSRQGSGTSAGSRLRTGKRSLAQSSARPGVCRPRISIQRPARIRSGICTERVTTRCRRGRPAF